jgi:hypothetical protein
VSFVFKTFERLILWHVEETALAQTPLHANQYAFRKGYSTEDALTRAKDVIEKGLYRGEFVVGVWMDIKGAFDNITPEAIIQSLVNRGVEPQLVDWYEQYLHNREAGVTQGVTTIRRKLKKGTPQGGVSSPVIGWNMPFDDLLAAFDHSPVHPLGFADDFLGLALGKSLPEVMGNAQAAIDTAVAWATERGLEFSVEKTQVLLFTRRRKYTIPEPLVLYGQPIPLSDTVKYLGVTFDTKLTWIPHILGKIKQAKASLMRGHSVMTKTWGPKPKYSRWLWSGVIMPALTYGCMVWHSGLDNAMIVAKLRSLQRLAMCHIAQARKSTPTRALEIIHNLPPLHLKIEELALKTFCRIRPPIQWQATSKRDIEWFFGIRSDLT